MRPEHVGVLVEGVIPFMAGIYVTLLAFRVIGPRPGVKPKMDDWHRRWSGFMRVGGPLLVVFAIFLWAKGFVYHPAPVIPPASPWTRHKSSDGVVSVEFPAPPTPVTKEAGGVVMHNVTLSQKDLNRHFILSWSETAPVDGLSDEERLDGLRESMPAAMAQQGMPVTLVSEETFTEGGSSGRLLVFDRRGETLMRMKCLILNGRFYRATATTSRSPQDEADGVRFVSTFRLEKGGK